MNNKKISLLATPLILLLLASILYQVKAAKKYSELELKVQKIESENVELKETGKAWKYMNQVSMLSEENKKLDIEIEEKDIELREKTDSLNFYKSINFKEMKLIKEYSNLDDSSKNIYVYTNSFNKDNIDSLKNVENCARIRFKDHHSNDCFIFIWDDEHKKFLLKSDFPISSAFDKKNTFIISSYFSGDWWWSNSTITINIDTWLMKKQTNITAPTETIEQINSETNIYECFDKNPMLVLNFHKCFK